MLQLRIAINLKRRRPNTYLSPDSVLPSSSHDSQSADGGTMRTVDRGTPALGDARHHPSAFLPFLHPSVFSSLMLYHALISPCPALASCKKGTLDLLFRVLLSIHRPCVLDGTLSPDLDFSVCSCVRLLSSSTSSGRLHPSTPRHILHALFCPHARGTRRLVFHLAVYDIAGMRVLLGGGVCDAYPSIAHPACTPSLPSHPSYPFFRVCHLSVPSPSPILA